MSNEEDIKKYEIDKNGEMLTALYSKVNNKRAINNKKATRLVTPLSQSSLFHWQTQSKTSIESATGKRYINHLKNSNKIALFVREHKTRDGLTSPFTYLGTCEYRSHTGNKPISFVWELNEEIPPSMINKANKTIII